MVADGSVNLDAMVTGAFTLNEVKQALESDGDPTSMKSIVYPTNLAGPLAGC
jgi:L-iditol 2-dehydrogenase